MSAGAALLLSINLQVYCATSSADGRSLIIIFWTEERHGRRFIPKKKGEKSRHQAEKISRRKKGKASRQIVAKKRNVCASISKYLFRRGIPKCRCLALIRFVQGSLGGANGASRSNQARSSRFLPFFFTPE